jgi:cytochrome P450
VIQTVVSTNPLAASMSAENFHDPWVFDPKRWMDSESHDIFDASQPFSVGSRNCLGQRYAILKIHSEGSLANTASSALHSLGWLEMRTILAKIHYKYDLEMVDKSLDWHAQSQMHTLWQKPIMKVLVKPRRD